MKNPFTLGIVDTEPDFCNRKKELRDLLRHARNGSNVVLCSPRRFGKSSLAKIILAELKKENFLTAYVDLFPISSEKDFVSRFAMSIFRNIGKFDNSENFVQKVKGVFKKVIPVMEVGQDGYSLSVKLDSSSSNDILLDDLMEGLCRYVKKTKRRACIVLDEFQEITELAESKKIEGILRSHIQSHHEISYFYVGSRRRILEDMFSNKARPFYKSAFFYALREISKDDFIPYIARLFKDSNKMCSSSSAEYIYLKVRGYPYYVQKLSSIAWDISENECKESVVDNAFNLLVESEKIDFEGVWSGLMNAQKTILKLFAKEPTIVPFSKDYIGKSGISLGGFQKALKALYSKDLVEKMDNGVLRLTDPLMEAWLKA